MNMMIRTRGKIFEREAHLRVLLHEAYSSSARIGIRGTLSRNNLLRLKNKPLTLCCVCCIWRHVCGRQEEEKRYHHLLLLLLPATGQELVLGGALLRRTTCSSTATAAAAATCSSTATAAAAATATANHLNGRRGKRRTRGEESDNNLRRRQPEKTTTNVVAAAAVRNPAEEERCTGVSAVQGTLFHISDNLTPLCVFGGPLTFSETHSPSELVHPQLPLFC